MILSARPFAQRMVEILKQDQYQSLLVEKQILIIFAGINGCTDDLPIEAIRKFEEGLFAFMDQTHPELGQEIRGKKIMEDTFKQKLDQVILEFKRGHFYFALTNQKV